MNRSREEDFGKKLTVFFWYFSPAFEAKYVKKVKLFTNDGRWTTHDDGRIPIALGHLSDSGNIKSKIHLKQKAFCLNVIHKFTEFEFFSQT